MTMNFFAEFFQRFAVLQSTEMTIKLYHLHLPRKLPTVSHNVRVVPVARPQIAECVT